MNFRKHKIIKLCLLVLTLTVGLVLIKPALSEAGIRVSPGAFCLQDAAVGKDLDLDIDMVVTNKSDEEKTFVIRPLPESEAKKKWIKGYTYIPDPNWLYFETNQLKIGPEQEAKIGMHLNVPDKAKYYNQHWIVYVEVTTKAEKGQMFKAAIAPNYMFETEANEDVKARPAGTLGLVPSTVKATVVVPGTEEKASFEIYNNENKKHTYFIYTYIPHASRFRQDISSSPGYQWIEDEDWVKPVKKKITIKPNEVKKTNLDIFIPEGKEAEDTGWEGIVYIEPDEGKAGFVRVQIEPLK